MVIMYVSKIILLRIDKLEASMIDGDSADDSDGEVEFLF